MELLELTLHLDKYTYMGKHDLHEPTTLKKLKRVYPAPKELTNIREFTLGVLPEEDRLI